MLIRTLHQQAFTPPRPVPPVLTLDRCRSLSSEARRQRAQAVRLWLRAQYLPSSRDEKALKDLDVLIEENRVSPSGTNDPAILTGDNAMGKSTLIERAARDWHRSAVGDDCDPLALPSWRSPAGVPAHYEPVVLLSLHGNTTASSFTTSLIEAMDHSPSAKVSPASLFFDHGTQILIVDDVHFLVTTEQRGARVLQEIKYILMALGELGGTVILVGANLETHPLMEDPQITSRSQPPSKFSRYRVDDDLHRKTWIDLLKKIERLVAPYLPAGHEGMLFHDAAGLTHQRTGGLMRDLLHLVRNATAAAIEDGTFKLTPAHLMAIELSERSRQAGQLSKSEPRRGRSTTSSGASDAISA